MSSAFRPRDPLLGKYGWYEWLCHSNFSFLVGASHPHEYLQRAAALGYAGLGFCDFDGVYGLARAHLDWRKLVAAGATLRLFHGAELRLAPDHHQPLIFQDTLVLLARDREGYAQLCACLSLAHRESKTQAWLSVEEFLTLPTSGLVAIQPMRGLIRRPGAWRQARERCVDLAAAFPKRFYLAVSRHLNPGEDRWIEPTLQWSRELGLPCLLTQDAFMHEPARKVMSDLLHAIRTNQVLDDAVAHMFINNERSLHHLQGIAARFQDLPIYEAALRSSRELAESCVFSMNELRYRYPKEMIPEGHTAQSFLEELVWREAQTMFGTELGTRIRNLLTHELDLIRQLGFADYFLTVWDIVRWARQQGILCQGRGSAANSATCYVLGITAVDPSRFDLLFERFISMERGDPPDIDVDFEHERREEVIQYIYRRYGRERAAMVANVITFRRKGALRAVGKALGLPEAALGEVSRRMATRRLRNSDMDAALEQVRARPKPASPTGLEETDATEENPAWAEIPWRLWGELAESLRGFPRHLGIHSGGFMLSDVPLTSLVALEPATMVGRTVVQWCKDDIEGLGFFKIDVLALGMLTAIRKSLDLITRHYGRALTLASIPAEDPATYAMIQRADTVGTFQIESRAQMSMLPRLKPREFYDLVIQVAIIRPGPIQGGMIHPYLRRRDGLEAVTFPDDRLRTILERTLGIPLFQEQVMRIAMAVGDFTPGEANELRRHMGSWTMKGDMGPWLTKLTQGMRRNGFEEEFIASILAQMHGFAHYGFPESHAASFALLAYASAWLKRHYPAAFFTALLNSQPMGFYSPHALLQTAQRDGVRVLPICVQRSHWDTKLESITEAGAKHGYGLRLGLRLVTGLGRQGAVALVKAREALGGRFADVASVLQHASLHRPDLTALAAADAFHALGLSRKAALWLAEAAPFLSTLEEVEEPVAFADESSMERIQLDFAATGVSLGAHPTSIMLKECWCYPVPIKGLSGSAALAKIPDGRVVHIFGMVLVRQSPPSANGMVFLTLEDADGFLNLTFSPGVYARFAELVDSQAFLCVRARLQRRQEAHSLFVMQVYAPALKRADVIPMSTTRPAAADAKDRWPMRPLAPSRNYM